MSIMSNDPVVRLVPSLNSFFLSFFLEVKFNISNIVVSVNVECESRIYFVMIFVFCDTEVSFWHLLMKIIRTVQDIVYRVIG